MPISSDRIQADIKAIAAFTETPGEGATRPTFSASWRKARDFVIAQLESLGCNVRIDAIGNVHARLAAISWDAAAWMSGSHLDTVARGGDYDGVLGVILPLEAFRAARENLKVALPMELVIWAEQEGAAFGQPMLGSRAFVGEIDPAIVGQAFTDAGAAMGVHAAEFSAPTSRLKSRSVIGFIEAHIEPGPVLWNENLPVALVTQISGHREYRCTLTGAPGAAGSVPMNERRDALVGAADVILALERVGKELAGQSFVTVTRINAHPNAGGAICGRVELAIDLASESTDVLARADQTIHHSVEQVAQHRSLEDAITVIRSAPAIEMDQNVCAKITRVAKAHCEGDGIRRLSTGGPHDAAVLARHVPSAMILVAGRDGLFHHPDEFCRAADVTLAAQILFDTVRDRRLE